jgi:glycosyltransferase involved in cell wall biosynthesis
MVVKDEEFTIRECLAPIRGVFDDFVIVDTGSSDATTEIVEKEFGVRPLRRNLDDFSSLGEARNYAASLARHPWILKIDADERMSAQDAKRLHELSEKPDCDGYFLTWTTYLGERIIDDYKLTLARNDCRELGLFHENVQQWIRRHNGCAEWLPGVSLLHYPDPERVRSKALKYRESVSKAQRLEPRWYRHHWFLGYMHFLAGEYDNARAWLSQVCAVKPRDFPVECLNSHMVLAEIDARKGDGAAVLRTIQSARDFYRAVQNDFEVKINFRLEIWLDQALVNVIAGNLEAIRAYSFAC